MDWLAKQEVHQLYQPTKLTKNIQNTILSKPKDQIGIDLIDMQNYMHNGYNYILTGIDLFSKKAYAVAMKTKSDKDMIPAIKKLLKQTGPIKSLRSDNGSEFISEKFKKVLADNNIKQVLSLSGKPQSNGNIERFNGQLKKLLRMNMKINQTNDWVSMIPTLIDNYNQTKSRVTKYAPIELEKMSEDKNVLENVKGNITKSVKTKNEPKGTKFKLLDHVRVKIDSDDKTRSGENWSKKIYTIWKLVKPKSIFSSPYYFIRDGKQKLPNKYYNNDLLLANVASWP